MARKKILIFSKIFFLLKSYLKLLKLQVQLKFSAFFYRPKLPHFVQNYPTLVIFSKLFMIQALYMLLSQ